MPVAPGRCVRHPGRCYVLPTRPLCWRWLGYWPSPPRLGQYGYIPQAISPSQSWVANIRGVGSGLSFGGLLGRWADRRPRSGDDQSRRSTRRVHRFPRCSGTVREAHPGHAAFQRDRRLGSSGDWGSAGYRAGSLIGPSSLMGLDARRGLSGYGVDKTALTTSYNDVLRGGWELGSRADKRPDDPLNILTWAGPAAGAVEVPLLPPMTQPASFPDEDRISLQMIVSNRLAVRRKTHLESGWAAFHERDYQAACSEFSLADGYSSVDRGAAGGSSTAVLRPVGGSASMPRPQRLCGGCWSGICATRRLRPRSRTGSGPAGPVRPAE